MHPDESYSQFFMVIQSNSIQIREQIFKPSKVSVKSRSESYVSSIVSVSKEF